MNKGEFMARYITIAGLIFIAVLSRLVPHPPNFTPITAIALFAAAYLGKRHAILVPMLAMLVSDFFIGFHSTMVWVYGSFLAISVIGFLLQKHRTMGTTFAATLAGSTIFFLVTNFGVWASAGSTYSHDTAGLIACYVAGIPFFRNTLGGDLLYVTMLFGSFELAKRYVPALMPEPDRVAS